LRLGVDRCANEITLDPDEDWPQVTLIFLRRSAMF
jgi:hypothetical protein